MAEGGGLLLDGHVHGAGGERRPRSVQQLDQLYRLGLVPLHPVAYRGHIPHGGFGQSGDDDTPVDPDRLDVSGHEAGHLVQERRLHAGLCGHFDGLLL